MNLISKDHPHYNGRTCTKCGETKSPESFSQYKDKRSVGGIAIRADCRVCSEKVKYKCFIKKTYGFTFEDYEKMLDDQNGCCAICKSKLGNSLGKRLFVDHCHDTLKVRGLLCSCCNMGLGQFKDSPTLLQKAIKYLTSDREVTNSVEYK